MADGTLIKVFPKATAGGGIPSGTDAVELLAAAALTTSYVYSNAIKTLGFATMLASLLYVKGSETTAQIIAQYAETTDGTVAGSTWRTFGVVQTPSAGGVSEVTKHVMQLTPANFDASDGLEIDIAVTGKQLVRFGVKYTGGSSPGTIAIKVAGGILATV